MHGKSGYTVNRGTVNRGITVVGTPTKIIMAYKRSENIGDQVFKRKQFANQDIDNKCRGNNKNRDQKCGRPRCSLCKNMSTTNTLQIEGQTIKLDMSLNCSDKNVIYIAQCKHCDWGFYIGQTWTPLSTRFCNHRSDFTAAHHHRSALANHIFLHHKQSFDSKLDNFIVGVILKCNIEALNKFEDIYIEKTKARILGLNRMRLQGN